MGKTAPLCLNNRLRAVDKFSPKRFVDRPFGFWGRSVEVISGVTFALLSQNSPTHKATEG
jgi:hypothetical protein